jgi:hypothetical protein
VVVTGSILYDQVCIDDSDACGTNQDLFIYSSLPSTDNGFWVDGVFGLNSYADNANTGFPSGLKALRQDNIIEKNQLGFFFGEDYEQQSKVLIGGMDHSLIYDFKSAVLDDYEI